MSRGIDMPDAALTANEALCFRVIGVWGDRSCRLLPEHVHCRNCPTYSDIGRGLLKRAAPQNYVEEWHERLAQSTLVEHTEQLQSVTIFRLGTEWLALPTANVREVSDPMPVRRLPHRRDPCFRGLTNIQGEILPCVDLKRLMGVKTAAVGKSEASTTIWNRMIVLENEGDAWAFVVDELEGIRRVPEQGLRRPPVTVEIGQPGFTEWVFSGTHGDVGLLEVPLLLHRLRSVCS